MKKLSLPSRLLLAIASVALAAAYFLPVWRIDLFAPQYPEGLFMNIWYNRLSGDVEIINGLNHYIGMKEISAGSFPEFKYLAYIIGFFILFGLAIAVTGKRRWLKAYLLLSLAGGALALYDFYRWGKEYGSDLNPNAPIKVPGLSYQPPVLGHKRLLNFDAYSLPDWGGWLVIGAVGTFFLVFALDWWMQRKQKNLSREFKKTALAAMLLLILGACNQKPQPIRYGTDTCAFCKMGVSDPRFGAELVSNKGKVYVFDDVKCMTGFMKQQPEGNTSWKHQLVSDYTDAKKLLNINRAYLVSTASVKSPMGGNILAFTDAAAAQKTLDGISFTPTDWTTLQSAYTQPK
jgi:copper chaperone NosL